MINNFGIKKQIIFKNSRKLKKRTFRKILINRINSINLTYNLLVYFLVKEKIFINRKVITTFLITENGTTFSLYQWVSSFYNKIY